MGNETISLKKLFYEALWSQIIIMRIISKNKI